jgi:hypothetical protein
MFRKTGILGTALLLIAVDGFLLPCASAIIVNIQLNGVIGPAGTNAADVDGAGNPVNMVAAAVNSGATTLSTTGVSFDFNTGFADTIDRTGGFPAPHVFADRKGNSLATPAGPLILDKNNNGTAGDETDSAPSDPNTFHFGFGMHAAAFVTFDLDEIRADNGVIPNTSMTLSGGTGAANPVAGNGPTSSAILLDGSVLGVYDWQNNLAGDFFSYNFSIPATGRFLTFIGLEGTDQAPDNAHIGFSDVQLAAQVPEPSALAGVVVLVTMRGVSIRIRRRGR